MGELMGIFTERVAAKEPETLIIIGKPKCGKTSIVSHLPKSVIIDYEGGTKYINHDHVIDVVNSDFNMWGELSKIKGQYEFGIIDTATSMEQYLMTKIVSSYNSVRTQDKHIVTIGDIPHGGGYGLLRQKTATHIDFLKSIFKRLIILGHTKSKVIDSDEIALDLALTGKNVDLVLSSMDTIAYMHRDKDDGVLSFEASHKIIAGSRVTSLDNRKIVISTKSEKHISTFWSEIYPDTLTGIKENS